MSRHFRDPDIPDGEKSIYTLRIANNPQTAQVSNIITHDGDGYRSVFDAGTPDTFAVNIEQRFTRIDGRLRAESYRSETHSDGRLVSREEGYFLGAKHIQFGGSLKPFPRDIMPLIGGLTLLRGLEFTKGAKVAIDLWLFFSVHWPLEAKVEKRTVIDVPADRIECWQVKIRPGFSHINGLLDKVVAGLLPPFTMHFEVAPPHRMVRFSFPSGPMPWNPRGTLELTA